MRFSRRMAHEALLISDADGDLGRELTTLGIPWSRVPRGRMRNPSAVWRTCSAVRSCLIERAPDVFLSNSAQGFLYGRLASIGLHVPGALYQMSVPNRRWWYNGPLDWFTAAGKPDLVLAASNTIRRRVERWTGGAAHTVYHGTSIPTSDPAEVERVALELSRRGVGADAPVVLMPGRLQAWKGQRLFLEAFAGVLSEFPAAHAVCLGSALFDLEPDYPAQLAAEVRQRGMEKNFHLLPHQRIAPWLARATVVVHASLSADAFPNVCIEALACSRPLVTNTLAGTAEVVAHGKEAMVVPPRNAAALADAIRALLRDPKKRDDIAEAGHRRYLQTCTTRHMVEAVELSLFDLAEAIGKTAAA
jgi:glycosyltransferase involved in cell wall biosynthesis